LSIDYDLHKQLRKPIAKSLLPVLQIGFYASEGKYTKRYDELCQFLGITRYKSKSRIKQQLEPSFKDLQNRGFLAEWDYDKIKLHETYKIIWWAGERFYEMQEVLQEREKMLTEPIATKKPKRITRPQNKHTKAHSTWKGATRSSEQEVKAEALSAPKPEETTQADLEPKQDREPKAERQAPEQQKQQPEPAPEKTKGESDLAEKLVELKVTRHVAEELVRLYDPKQIKEWVQVIPYVSDAKDKAAFLVKAIKEGWAVSDDLYATKERRQQAKQMERLFQKEEEKRVREKAEEMERKKQEAERLDGIYDSLFPKQQEAIDKEAEKRLPDLVQKYIREGRTDSAMVEANLLSKKREVLKEWLEDGKIKVDDKME
jgi:hypothetical protein